MAQDMIPWLYGLQHFGVKLGLDNIRAALDLLVHPESAYPSMLVAGPNGKGLVASMLEGGGFEVIDLGVDVPPEKFVETAKQHKADIIALSALLTTTMTSMKSVLEALNASGIREQVKVIIGGAPVTQQYCDSIAADGYSATASGAVSLAREMV